MKKIKRDVKIWKAIVLIIIGISIVSIFFESGYNDIKKYQISEIQQDSLSRNVNIDALPDLFKVELTDGFSEKLIDFGIPVFSHKQINDGKQQIIKTEINRYGQWFIRGNNTHISSLTRNGKILFYYYTFQITTDSILNNPEIAQARQNEFSREMNWGKVYATTRILNTSVNTMPWKGIVCFALVISTTIYYFYNRKDFCKSKQQLHEGVMYISILLVFIVYLGFFTLNYSDNKYSYKSARKVTNYIANCGIDWKDFLNRTEHSGLLPAPNPIHSQAVSDDVFVGKNTIFPIDFIRFNLDMNTYVYYFGEGDAKGFIELNDHIKYTQCDDNFYLAEYTDFKNSYRYKIFETVILAITVIIALILWIRILVDIIHVSIFNKEFKTIQRI